MEQAGRLLSSIDLRIFGAGQNDKAIAWAAEIPARTNSPAFHRIKTSADNVYAFAINGVISADEMSTVIRDIDEFLDRHEKVRLLAKIGTFGFDPTILMQKGLFAMKMAAIQKVERYAIVGGPSWLQSAAKMAGPMVPGMEIQTFAEDDESKAWEWLEATAA